MVAAVVVVAVLAVVMFFLDIVIPLSCASIFVCFGSCLISRWTSTSETDSPCPLYDMGESNA